MQLLLKIGVAVLVFSSVGCSAHWVRQQYEPVKGGSVAYLGNGAEFVIDRRIADAKAKIADFCGGPFKLVSQDINSTNSGAYTSKSIGGGYYTQPMSSDEVVMNFLCL